MLAPLLLVILLGLIAYVCVGYPLVIALLARFRERPVRAAAVTPSITVVVVAHDEASRIGERLENLLALDYPSDRLEILMASDGSTDGTPERARRYEPMGVTVIAFETRRGKAAVLNDVIPKARGEIVALADTRQRFSRDAVSRLVAPFADPEVGAVSGQLVLAGERGTPGGEGVGFYWRYEKFIRRNESRLDSTVGATGAIYAIRRPLFEAIPEDTILDDVLIPVRIARRGYRVVFEPRALAHDPTPVTPAQEFARKVRTIAGNFQLLARERWLLDPFRNRLWFQTVSHKALRLTGPVILAAALGLNLLVADRAPFGWLLAGQLAFYALALAGWALARRARGLPFVSVAYTFCLLNWATVLAFVRFMTGRQPVTWEKAS